MEALQKVKDGFLSLRGSPTELWLCYVLKFLDSYSYFSFSVIFTLFLSDEFGFSDVTAGTLYGAWGALITIYGVFSGWIVDNMGVAASLRWGFLLSFVSRTFILFTTSRTILLLNICGILPLANCLGIPVLTTGIRRYTTESNRGFAFGLFYVIMNVAALLSGPVVDAFTILYKADDAGNQTSEEWSLTSYRAIILTGVIANAVACSVTLFVREIKVVTDTNSLPTASSSNSSVNRDEGDDSEHRVDDFVVSPGTPTQILRETIQTKSFWRFLVVCLITLNVRMIFRHLDATLPKYMVREFGEDVPKGTIYSINPALIIILVPLVTAATTTVEPLVMIHHGSYVSAASVFFLVLSTSVPACILFVVVLSVGEAAWSPRLYDYTMSVVKEGREGTYMALSSAPLFLAKLPVGFMSGYLLQEFCPEEGERHSKTMWLIIGLTTAVSPILLTVFWGYVSKKDDDEPKYTELPDLHNVASPHEVAEAPPGLNHRLPAGLTT
jgi:dipeptide/tripeptide permease